MGNTFVHKRVDGITCGCDGPDGKVVLCNFHMKRRFGSLKKEGLGANEGLTRPPLGLRGGRVCIALSWREG